MTMLPEAPPVVREHDLIGWCNPRCRRCHRTAIELAAHPTPCRPVPVKAQLTLPLELDERRPA
jgi:hypothetical protein